RGRQARQLVALTLQHVIQLRVIRQGRIPRDERLSIDEKNPAVRLQSNDPTRVAFVADRRQAGAEDPAPRLGGKVVKKYQILDDDVCPDVAAAHLAAIECPPSAF